MTLQQHMFGANLAYEQLQEALHLTRKAGKVVSSEDLASARKQAQETFPLFPLIEARRGQII